MTAKTRKRARSAPPKLRPLGRVRSHRLYVLVEPDGTWWGVYESAAMARKEARRPKPFGWVDLRCIEFAPKREVRIA